MTSRPALFFLAALLLLGLVLRSPILLLLGTLLALVAGASALWGRYCLAGVSYDRAFSAGRLFCGESADLWVEIANAKPLPLAWLKAEDEFPEELEVQNIRLSYASTPHRLMLTGLFTMNLYERIRRRYRLTAPRRGAFDFGPVLLSSGDLFGFQTRYARLDRLYTLLVYPKLVMLEALGLRAARPPGDLRAQRRILADPLRLAGARDYQPGDAVRHVHWKATARRCALQTKIFDPGASQHLIIFLNNQTQVHHFEGIIDDYFETAAVAAAAVAREWLEARHAVGLFTNGAVRGSERRARIPASRRGDQLVRILEALAQLTYFSNLSFDVLLQVEATQLPLGSTVVAVSTVVTGPILSALLDLRAGGHPVALVVIGPKPASALPPELPAYFVTKNWTEMESIGNNQ